MLDYSLVRLFKSDISQTVSHIQNMSSDDKYLRFGYVVSDERILDYVSKSFETVNSKESSDFWFGIMASDTMVATLHVSIRDDVGEFAFTTDVNHRGKKLGQLLFARGWQLISEFRITRIYMACLSKNSAMRHIAKKFGMSVMTFGTDSEASVNIQYPVSLARLNEVKTCCIDKAIISNSC